MEYLWRASHLIEMTIEDYMRTLERAWVAALPGREAAERETVLRELRRAAKPRSATHGCVSRCACA